MKLYRLLVMTQNTKFALVTKFCTLSYALNLHS